MSFCLSIFTSGFLSVCQTSSVLHATPLSQEVMHAHVHIVPRWEGDRIIEFPPSGPMIEKDDAAKLLGDIKAHVGN